MGLEVELKFSASGPEPLEHLSVATALGPAALGPVRTIDERDRYLDTRDGRLAGALWACRLRSRGGRTIVSLKGPAHPASGDATQFHEALHRRPELEGPASELLQADGWEPSAARQLLLDLTRGGELVERLALDQERTERSVNLGTVTTATLSLDRVRVTRRGEAVGSFLTVELEMDPEATDSGVISDLARALLAIPGLAPDPTTKLERALDFLAS